jgi:hypothetical protein
VLAFPILERLFQDRLISLVPLPPSLQSIEAFRRFDISFRQLPDFPRRHHRPAAGGIDLLRQDELDQQRIIRPTLPALRQGVQRSI